MRDLRRKLEADTGEQWALHHILHNNASVGGAAIRRRYFWCVSRIPFGIDPVVTTRVPHLIDVIGDLQGLSNTWEKQVYRRPPSWWARPRRSRDGVVDGHKWRNDAPANKRALALLEGTSWDFKETISIVAKRYYEQHGRLPDNWGDLAAPKLVGNEWSMGFNQIARWHPNKMARVITGHGLDQALHPYENRTLTHREVARIQGFPDDWRILPLRRVTGIGATWGKGIPVDAGRWVGEWIYRALEGNPSDYPGEPGEEEREWVYNCTEAYRAVSSER